MQVAVMRLPQVHDSHKQGLITPPIDMFRDKGVATYVGDDGNRYSAAHLSDVARLYRLAFEKQEAARYHAVPEEGVPIREIVEALGRGLNVPVRSVSPDQAGEHFGWMAMVAGVDLSTSSAWTRSTLGWQPTGPGLLADLDVMRYGAAA